MESSGPSEGVEEVAEDYEVDCPVDWTEKAVVFGFDIFLDEVDSEGEDAASRESIKSCEPFVFGLPGCVSDEHHGRVYN
ncbi:hypothetical protein HNV12_01430 [Methanococcoides sp. SA1]|nr:hypothetical protein [Methanococcoides sp. SA1]